jgi:indole-3-glycerol phosphate synthase
MAKFLAFYIVAVLVLTLTLETSSFIMVTKNVHQSSFSLFSTPGSATAAADSAVNNLIKKAKMKIINTLLKEVEEQGDTHPINQFLKEGTLPFGMIGKPTDFHYMVKGNVKGLGTIAVIPEYNKKVKTGFIAGMPPPEIMGGVLRDAGAKGIVVSMEKRSGGASPSEFTRFAVEQSRSLLMLPPPIPCIWNDQIMHTIQIAEAGANGASAIVLNPDLTEDLDSFVAYAFKLGMAPIVLVRSVADADSAIAAGAQCLCIHSMGDQAIVDLKNDIFAKHKGVSEELVMIAKIRPAEDFPIYHEIDLCWMLRDSGFAAVWPSPESVYGTGFPDIYSNVMAMRAKASRIFLSPRQFLMDRKKEGAQEYLGDILY